MEQVSFGGSEVEVLTFLKSTDRCETAKVEFV